MMRHYPSPLKRRTREHIIADLSVNHVERQALLSNYFVERWLHDYGMDLVLWTFTDDGDVERGSVFLQVKASDRLKFTRNGLFVSIRIERSDLRAWLSDPMPVILVAYDAGADRAYWLYVQAVFGGVRRFASMGGSETVTVRIPVQQILDPAAVRRFRSFRDDVKAQSEGVIHRE